MKDRLDKDKTAVEAGCDAPTPATCPACGATVHLRDRRIGKNPDDRTWYYRHRPGEGRNYLWRSKSW